MYPNWYVILGIRFGEMERDSLLGHGTAFLLHDRLMNCSDYHVGYVCIRCGSVISTQPNFNSNNYYHIASNPNITNNVYCRSCESSNACATIAIPYVFMYLVNELAAMNIKITLDVK